MTDRLPNDHTTHDRLLLSAWAAGDADATDRETAERLASSCAECALLADDLRALARATAELPRPVRRRDFTLKPGDADRARRRGWRRLVAAFGGPRFDFARPLAAGLTTLGLAGFLLATVPGMPGSAAAPAGAPSQERMSVDGPHGSPGALWPASGYDLGSGGAAPSGQPAASADALAGEAIRPDGSPDAEEDAAAARDPRAASPLAVLSGSFLIVGLGLFGLRWSARRLGDG
jgi:hypothetical protein